MPRMRETRELGEADDQKKGAAEVSELEESQDEIAGTGENWFEEYEESCEQALKEKNDNQGIPEDLYEDPEYQKVLYEEFDGDMNERVLNVQAKEYIQEGIRRPDWGNDAEGKIRPIVLLRGTDLVRYSIPGREDGRYFTSPNVPFEKLELPYSEDKYEKRSYHVMKDIPVLASRIAKQTWNEKDGAEKEDGATQFFTGAGEQELVKRGIIKSNTEGKEDM